MRRIFLSACAIALTWSSASHALVTYTKAQQKTASELVEQLEQRHYSKLEYGDELSSEHLDNYLDSLDG